VDGHHAGNLPYCWLDTAAETEREELGQRLRKLLRTFLQDACGDAVRTCCLGGIESRKETNASDFS